MTCRLLTIWHRRHSPRS